MKYPLLCMFLLITNLLHGQEYLYVNTDNLIMRDRPEQRYMVYAILHAPCKLKIEPTDEGYKNDKGVQNKFYRVSISYEIDGRNHFILGWVVKKFVVRRQEQVTVKDADMSMDLLADEVDISDYRDEDGENPKRVNAAEYTAPIYKGGEPQIKKSTVTRKYLKGPRGGCYYISGKNNKVYVDAKYCKDKGHK